MAEFGPSAGRDPLRLEQLLHCSLDVVDERAAAPALPPSASATVAPTAPAGGPYLGMIYAADRRRVYAQVTATRVVLLLVAEDATVRDDEAAGVFRRIHNALADALCNPFYVQGTARLGERGGGGRRRNENGPKG